MVVRQNFHKFFFRIFFSGRALSKIRKKIVEVLPDNHLKKNKLNKFKRKSFKSFFNALNVFRNNKIKHGSLNILDMLKNI